MKECTHKNKMSGLQKINALMKVEWDKTKETYRESLARVSKMVKTNEARG